MTNRNARFEAAHYEPRRNDVCVCGSGIKFKKCCAGKYSGSVAFTNFRRCYNRGDYEGALIHARYHFTWYSLSHRAHAVPMLASDLQRAKELLDLDIEALSELLGNLHLCYFRLGKSNDFPSVIEHSKDIVSHEKWRTKIAFAKGLWNLVDKKDRFAAFASLNIVEVEKCQDPDFLSLYLEVCEPPLRLTESICLIDRILANSTSAAVTLQYRVLKALKYYFVGDQVEGGKVMDSALSAFAILPDKDKPWMGKTHFAHALEMYGKILDRKDILERAKEVTNTLITEADVNNYGDGVVAELRKLLGDCQEALGNHKGAIEAYLESLHRCSSELTKVFLVRSICNSGDVVKARESLDAIDDSQLSEPEKFDLAISWSVVAANSLCRDDLEIAKHHLTKVKTSELAFAQIRDGWMIELLEAKPQGAEPGRIRSLIMKLNKYIALKPTIFGVGINVNQIIDDIDKSTQNKKK